MIKTRDAHCTRIMHCVEINRWLKTSGVVAFDWLWASWANAMLVHCCSRSVTNDCCFHTNPARNIVS